MDQPPHQTVDFVTVDRRAHEKLKTHVLSANASEDSV